MYSFWIKTDRLPCIAPVSERAVRVPTYANRPELVELFLQQTYEQNLFAGFRRDARVHGQVRRQVHPHYSCRSRQRPRGRSQMEPRPQIFDRLRNQANGGRSHRRRAHTWRGVRQRGLF